MRRIVLAVVFLALPLAARAEVSLGLELTLAAPRLGVMQVPGSSEPLSATGDVGGAILLRLWGLGLGASIERGTGGGVHRDARSAMGGLIVDLLPLVRLELLGEIGQADAPSGLVRFTGARPGLSIKAPGFPLRVGAWGLARWGLPGVPAGQPAYGLLARAGLEF